MSLHENLGCRSCPRVGLDTPFTSQDKPPLAVAVRSLKRYRLVIAQKLRLTQEVTAALASHSREHRLTGSGFFRVSSIGSTCMARGRLPLSFMALCSYNGSPVLVHRLRGNKIHLHQASKDQRTLITSGIHYFDARRLQPQLLQAPALQIHLRVSHLAGLEGAGETVEDPRRMKSEPPPTGNLRWRWQLKMQIFLLKNHGAHQFRTHLMIPRKWKSQVLLTSCKP